MQRECKTKKVMVGYIFANPPDKEIFTVMKTYLLG